MKDELSKNGVRMVGQSPNLTEKWDDKANTNIWLGKQKGLEGGFPKSRVLYKKDDRESLQVDEDGLGWPRVMKPIRGRGSHGVAVVKDQEGFLKHLDTLFSESDAVLVEVRDTVSRRNGELTHTTRNSAVEKKSQSLCSHLESTPPSDQNQVIGRSQ
jgi:carbamoylphosphate synthase large subunit